MKLKTLVYLILITLVASFSPAAHSQTFRVIHTFNGLNGMWPDSGVTIQAGILYGTTLVTQFGNGPGSVYQMSRIGSTWAYTPILFFTAGGDPSARVVFGPDNRLYGTAQGGILGRGLVFSLTPPRSICKTANCFSTEEVLYQFTDNLDGDNPGAGDLIWDAMGNIYGSTVYGRNTAGTVYQMTKSGNNWTETPIYNFSGGSDGSNPYSGVIFDNNGNLFGTTYQGGVDNRGTVFELTFDGIGWTEKVLYNFRGPNDGRFPYAGLIRDSAGNLYGAASGGGSGGGGTVFELSPVGDTWTFTVLYSFAGRSQDSICGPQRSLTMDAAGNLYGTTVCDGSHFQGNVFKLANTANGWVYMSLYDFTGGPDGGFPVSHVTIDTDGILYGTAGLAGDRGCNQQGCGTVWMIKP